MSPVRHLKACTRAYSFSNAIVIFLVIQTGVFLLTLMMVILIVSYSIIRFIKLNNEEIDTSGKLPVIFD